MACRRKQDAIFRTAEAMRVMIYGRVRSEVMRIGICDDEEVQRRYLKEIAEQWALKNGEKAVCDCYSDSEAFLFAWEENKSYDVLLLDIEMKEMNGMELARRIRQEDEEVALVFITGYEEYIGQGYEVSALHYLTKPLDEEKFYRVLDRAMAARRRAGIRQMFETAEGCLSIVLNDIWYVEAFAHYCTLHLKDCEYQVKRSISSMEELIMDEGRRIPVSRRNYRQVNEAFFRYFRK